MSESSSVTERFDVNGGRSGEGAPTKRRSKTHEITALVQAVRYESDETVQRFVLDLSQRSRLLAPLALVVGAFVMLGTGLRLLVTNWRLTLIEIVPAMLIWVAMFDLKFHLLHGKQFHVIRGPLLVLVMAGIVLVTAASFYLNAVFAFAIAKGGTPEIGPAFAEARGRLGVVLGWGIGVGLLVGFASAIVVRWGLFWFTIALSIVIAILMVCYIAVPSRLIGVVPVRSRRDKWTASAVGGALGAIVCSPPYALGRVGVILLGIRGLFIVGLVMLSVGAVLQAGATGAVKSVKLSARLVGGQRVDVAEPAGAHSEGNVQSPSGWSRPG
jgi:hypothetical protein